ncbi:MAG: efflux RND transporter permease subunit [Myxococcota bacterium]
MSADRRGILGTVVHRPVLVTVVTTIVLLFGLLAYGRLSIDILPEVSPPVLTVVASFPGASAEDVESTVTEPLEQALGSVNGLEQLRSTSRDNVSITTLIFDLGYDLSEATTDVRAVLEAVSLTEGVDEPRILKFDPGALPAITFSITDRTGDVRLRRDLVQRTLIEPIERLPGVGAVVLQNAPKTIVRVDVDRDRLRAAGLTLTELSRVLAADNTDLPAGTLEVGDTQFAVRLPGEANSVQELRDRIVQRSPIDGSVARLSDVATVTIALDDRTEIALVDGQPAMTATVTKVGNANTVAVAQSVRDLLAKAELPAGVEVEVARDPSQFIRAMVANLQQTVLVGGVLVFVVVLVFLRRLPPSLVVATTIPTSLVTTFMVLERLGYTLNAVTLMAMALAIGMVVDNGIVVLENIARRAEAGEDPKSAAVAGAREVGGALLASTTTTVVIFVPMSFASGIIGAMFGQLSYVMITTISSSLIVALTLTPMLAARAVGATPARTEPTSSSLAERYGQLLERALGAPWTTLGVALATVVLTIGLVVAVPTDFVPRQDQSRASVTVQLPVGTSLDRTAAVVREIATAFQGDPDVRLITEYAGASSDARAAGRGQSQGSHIGRVYVFLTPKDDRTRTDIAIVRAAIERIPDQPEVVTRSVAFGDDAGLGIAGKPLVVELLGSDGEALETAAKALARDLRTIEGAVDVSTDLPETRPELRLDLSRDRAKRAGVVFALAGQELRAALTGVAATRLATADGTKDVVVRLAPEDRDEVRELGLVSVRARDGRLLSLADLATFAEGETPIAIKRLDKGRIVTVEGDVVGRALGEVTADVRERIAALETPPGITVRLGGSSADLAETFTDLGLLAVLGLVLVYLVMAAQFESWIDPLVILVSVPFAVTGAFFALLLTGTSLSVTSFLGVVILIGVVVNNAIVLVDAIKQLEGEGLPTPKAIRVAGRRRLRPVLITTLTTTGGMIPLAIASGVGAELWTPMGRTALGGLVVSTVVTLVLLPVVYDLVARFRART